MVRPFARFLVFSFSALWVGCASVPPHPTAPRYDVVLTGGRIVDGSGNPWTYGDVGVVGDRIVRVAPVGSLAGAAATRRNPIAFCASSMPPTSSGIFTSFTKSSIWAGR